MDPLIKLGPFEATIKNRDIEVGEIDKLNLGKSLTDILDIDLIPDEYVNDNGSDDERAYASKGSVDIEWGLEILSNDSGVWSIVPTINKAKGYVVIEAIPYNPDAKTPANDRVIGVYKNKEYTVKDKEFKEYTIDFTTESSKWMLTYDKAEFVDCKLSEGIFPIYVELNFESKTINVGF